MGGPIARSLLRRGHEVHVTDIDPARVKALVAEGATAQPSAAELARRTEVSLSIVMSDDILLDVALGPAGVLAGAAGDHIYVDLSTVSPHASGILARAARKRARHYLTARVAGSVGLAERGELTVFASGPRTDFDAVSPVLESIGRQVAYVGADEAAAYLKLAHSIVVGGYAALIGEAVTFARAGGVDYRQAIDILSTGPLSSQQLTLKAPILKAREFDAPPSDIDTAAKDLDVVLRTRSPAGSAVPLPVTALVRQVMAMEQARDCGGLDIWAVIRAFEAMSGLGAPDA